MSVPALLVDQVTGRGARGVVAAAAPIAAGIGAAALRDGGNAYDAAVAAALAETVLLPPKCGLAGDLVALTWGPGQDAPQAVLAIGGAPAGLAAAIAAGGLPDTGPRSVGVPAAPAGYALLAERAIADRDRLAEPARRLARDGFPWAPIVSVLTEESADLIRRHNEQPTSYLPADGPRHPGALTRLPGLATVLDAWVERGAELFTGPLGEVIVERVRADGGVLAVDDLRFGVAETLPADGVELEDGAQVWATPAPTHGPALLEVMLAHAHDPRPSQLWRQVRAAIDRRDQVLADPRASGTSMVSAADADGNVVVIIHSNSYPRYGSGLIVDELDLILGNRAGRGFSSDPAHPNFPAPGRRPATTLHAWAYRGGDGRAFLGGTPGGVNQLPWNAQLLGEVVRGARDPGPLVTAPRWGWVVDGDGAEHEEGLAPEVVATLRTEAGWTEEVGELALRCAQQVVERPRPGVVVTAAVDPRTGGGALGV